MKMLNRKRIRIIGAEVALISAEMLAIIVSFAGVFLLFIYMIRKVFREKETELDQQVFTFLQAHVSERNNEIMQFLTFLGSHDFLIPANLILIAYFLFIKKHKWYSIKIPAIALSSLALMFGLKHLFGRQRPESPLLQEAQGLSFPSGHALFSVTFYGLLVYIIYKSIENRVLKWTLITFCLLLIFTIGLTRIYLRVHYTTDVIAGFSVGFLWLVFSLALLNKIEWYSHKKLDAAVENN